MASSFKSYVTSGVGTSETTIYTALHSTTVIGLSLADVLNVAVTGSAKLYKSGGGSAYLVKNAPIPSGGTMVIVGSDQKVVLEIGDSIKATANTAASVDVIISTLEFS